MIGDYANKSWEVRIRTAAVELNKQRANRDPSLGIRLLTDCKVVFDSIKNTDRITTADLLEKLVALEESPWGDLRGNPLEARGLARRLRPYEVRPGDHRFDDSTKKGYLRENFYDAWSRYLPPDVGNKGNGGNGAS